MDLLKYPRTQHIQGSRLQAGDEDLSAVKFSTIAGRHIVVEEKMDGANSAISFDENGAQLLQSRGHYLTGGASEKHFHLFKQWAAIHAGTLHSVLGSRYICFGEWLYAKHTVFYDCLPHYWLEFDIFDRDQGSFLCTDSRKQLLKGLPIVPVRVLFSGRLQSSKELISLLGDSAFISETHIQTLQKQALKLALSEGDVIKETDGSRQMEGLYIKVEENGCVTERYKFIRQSFLTAVVESESHWLNRPIVPNLLEEGVDLFAHEPGDRIEEAGSKF